MIEPTVGYFAPDARPWWRRLLSRLFPSRLPPYLDDVDGMAPGYIATHVVAHLDWADRLRVLASGRVHVATSTRTDVTVNKMYSESTVWVEAPWQ